jgi:hypothetical protein
MSALGCARNNMYHGGGRAGPVHISIMLIIFAHIEQPSRKSPSPMYQALTMICPRPGTKPTGFFEIEYAHLSRLLCLRRG